MGAGGTHVAPSMEMILSGSCASGVRLKVWLVTKPATIGVTTPPPKAPLLPVDTTRGWKPATSKIVNSYATPYTISPSSTTTVPLVNVFTIVWVSRSSPLAHTRFAAVVDVVPPMKMLGTLCGRRRA